MDPQEVSLGTREYHICMHEVTFDWLIGRLMYLSHKQAGLRIRAELENDSNLLDYTLSCVV